MTETPPEALQLYDRFMAETGPDRFQKILARYELFKMIADVPGDIVECGVFKGSGLYAFAKFRQIFMPNNLRQIVGFDFFEGDRTKVWKHKEDAECVEFHAGSPSRAEIMAHMKNMGCGTGVELIAGDVTKTTAEYVKDNLGLRISLLYLDVDNYEGTLACLENLYPCVCRGGVVAFDEYALRTYGESDAVDDFFAKRDCELRSFNWAATPTAYVVKR